MENELTQQQKLKLLSMNTKCIQYRGLIIHHFAQIETTIENLIAEYFCSNNLSKQKELMYSLLSTEKITFNTKFSVFSFIVRANYSDFLENNVGFLEDIDSVAQDRNRFAHNKFMQTLEMINNNDGNNVTLEAWKAKNGKLKLGPFILNSENIQNTANKMNNIISVLSKLKSFINMKDAK